MMRDPLRDKFSLGGEELRILDAARRYQAGDRRLVRFFLDLRLSLG